MAYQENSSQYQSTPRENSKFPVITYTQEGKKLLFDNEVNRQPSDEVIQMKMVGASGGKTLSDKDITEYERSMPYVDSNKVEAVLLTTQNKGCGKLEKEQPFGFGRILRLDYEDPSSQNLILLVNCSKGVRKMFLSEDRLVKYSCGPESFKVAIETANNLITTLRPYIQGHVSLKEASPSPIKVAPIRPTAHLRPVKKKVTKMFESKSSSSIDDEDDRTTPGQSCRLVSFQPRKTKLEERSIRKSLCGKDSSSTSHHHIHRLPVDEKTGC